MSADATRKKIVALIAAETKLSPTEVVVMLEKPKQEAHGDLAFPCFRLAKTMRKAPPVIAAELKEKLFAPPLPEGLAKVEPVAGYLNFTLATDTVITDLLRQVLEQGGSYGSMTEGKGRKVVLEYSSVNIAKPFGIGHLRSTIIGAALNRVYRKLGYETISINHLGDWGTQFGKLIAAYRLWGSEYEFADNAIYDLYDLYVRFHEAAKSDPALEEKGREEFRKLESGDTENERLWRRFHDYSMRDFNRIYEQLGVRFDYLTGESFYQERMTPVIEKLDKQHLLTVSEGAAIVDLTEYDMPPCLLKKSDDATLYATRDLTALLYRKDTFNFDKILYVVGSAQKLHFRQFFKVAELMGNEWVAEQAVHVDFGWVKFSGQMMSSRAGTLIFFDDVFAKARETALEIVIQENPGMDNVDWTAEKVTIAALVFTQLKVRRNRDVNFVWEDAFSFRGATGPYLQYTHARLTSLASKYGKPLPDLSADLLLLGDEEKQVTKRLEAYPAKIKQVAESYETSFLAEYLLDLAAAINSYWQRIRIITDDEKATTARMQMAYAVRVVIADGLRLLGIEPLKRM
ncbi:MAG: arginine--tRNA ligase [candidate division Zixibacteria bacterium]|nr:arginine--tRNA ligase [candidate division Zixibacteria bacterium]